LVVASPSGRRRGVRGAGSALAGHMTQPPSDGPGAPAAVSSVAALEPQKLLLLAPLLGPLDGPAPAAPPAGRGNSCGIAAAEAHEPEARTWAAPEPVDRAAAGRRQRWSEICEEDEEDELPARLEGEALRERLLAHERLVLRLQTENASLADALNSAREQWTVATAGAAALQKENEALRKELETERLRHELRQKHDRQTMTTRPPQEDLRKDPDVVCDSAKAEPSTLSLEAELHQARVALVSIVPELERRLGERDASLAEAEKRVCRLEAQLQEERRVARHGRLRLLSLFRPHVAEGEAVWQEAEDLVAVAAPAERGSSAKQRDLVSAQQPPAEAQALWGAKEGGGRMLREFGGGGAEVFGQAPAG